MTQIPQFKKPSNILALIDANEGAWEDDVTWSPFLVSVTAGSELDGRAIPLAWQLEFDPTDECFSQANDELAQQDIEPDGYGWGDAMQQIFGIEEPDHVHELHIDDCETSTCVLWVESEAAFKALLKWTANILLDSTDD